MPIEVLSGDLYPNEVRIPFPNPISDLYAICANENDPAAGNGRHRYLVNAKNKNGDVVYGAAIHFQKGALTTVEPNGVLSTVVLAILIDHLKSFQTGAFANRETACAITRLEEAYHWLAARADDRASRGVLGDHKK